MQHFILAAARAACLAGLALFAVSFAEAQPQFSSVQRLTNREIALTLSGQSGSYYRLEVASNLLSWDALTTMASAAASTLQYTDSAAPFLESRYYRAQQISGSNIFVGDHLTTTNGDVIIQPRAHAAFVLNWQGLTIYVDPTNTVAYPGVPKADLILVTHSHSDHFSTQSIDAMRGTNALIVAPQDVYNQLTPMQRGIARVLPYGASTNHFGISLLAVPAYNSFHPLGVANAYVLTIGGRRIFVSGDTGNTTEMRALSDIDVAFVCMNQPYTMTVNEATNAVTAFRPKVVYPYHYRDSTGAATNAAAFKQRLRPDLGIEVRLRKWY